MNNKTNLKTLVFSFTLAAMTLTDNNLNAQNDDCRGILGRGASIENPEQGSKTLFNKNTDRGAASGGMTNQTFETPLGGGIAILLAAGLGYVALKKKEDEQ